MEFEAQEMVLDELLKQQRRASSPIVWPDDHLTDHLFNRSHLMRVTTNIGHRMNECSWSQLQ